AALAALALAQAPPMTIQQQQEVDVLQTDGGTFLPSGAPDQQLVPPVLLAPSPAPYPDALKAAPISGTVERELLIDDHADVAEARVSPAATPANPAFEEAALQAAKGLHFTPAQVGERPVAVRLRYSYVFQAPPPPPVMGKLTGEVREKGTRKPLAGASLVGE